MGRSLVRIPLPEPPTERQRSDIDTWVRSLATSVFYGDGEWQAWIEDARSFGPNLEERYEPNAFYVQIVHVAEIDGPRHPTRTLAPPDDAVVTDKDLRRAETVRALGYDPRAYVILETSGKTGDHMRILGQMALLLAERYSGWVDFVGAITPPRRPGQDGGPTLDEISDYVHRLPGRVVEGYYTVQGGRRWVSHMVDVEFFRAWLQHPDFHVLK
jgi:hypothetical protein